jgi:hypothetical protein
VGANGSEFPGLATGAKILDIHQPLNHQSRAISRFARLYDSIQQRRLPTGRKHPPLGQQSPSVLHHLPPGSFLKKGIIQLHIAHVCESLAMTKNKRKLDRRIRLNIADTF